VNTSGRKVILKKLICYNKYLRTLASLSTTACYSALILDVGFRVKSSGKTGVKNVYGIDDY
jgi:hypothetical protein